MVIIPIETTSTLQQGEDGTMLPRSHGRKTVSVMRGLMMLCPACYDTIHQENLVDKKNYVADHEAFFDLICPGCEDLNRPLIDDMLGSSE
jgi:hypothetical protein